MPELPADALPGDETTRVEPASAEQVRSLEDRVLHLEAALAHLLDRFGIDPHALPDALGPRLHTPSAADEVPR